LVEGVILIIGEGYLHGHHGHGKGPFLIIQYDHTLPIRGAHGKARQGKCRAMVCLGCIEDVRPYDAVQAVAPAKIFKNICLFDLTFIKDGFRVFKDNSDLYLSLGEVQAIGFIGQLIGLPFAKEFMLLTDKLSRR
jgi:hypothetical protein